MRYVWLDMNTGRFSNSWNQEEHESAFGSKGIADIPGWKLIKYECLNDEKFEFYELMQIVTKKEIRG